MIGPGETSLIYTKYTCLDYGTYLLFCMCYPKSVGYMESHMDFCTYVYIFDTIRIIDKKLLNFKPSESGKSFHVDKTSFLLPGHIIMLCNILH